MIYLIVVLLLFFGIKFDKNANSPSANRWWFFELIILILLAGLRYRVGGDTIGYMYEYDNMPTLNNLDWDEMFNLRYQPLWVFLVAVCRSISEDFVVLQIVLSIFVNTTIFWFIRKYSIRPFLVVLFYALFLYLNFNTEILRQSISNCIFLIAIPSLLERRYLMYIGLAILSFGFHTAGAFMLFIPLMLFLFEKINAFVLILFIMIGIFALSRIAFVQEYLEGYLFLSSIAGNVDYYGDHTLNFNGVIYYIITLFLIPALVMIFCKTNNIFINSFIKLYVFTTGVVVFMPIMNRFAEMFELPLYIALTNFYYNRYNSKNCNYSITDSNYQIKQAKDATYSNVARQVVVLMFVFVIFSKAAFMFRANGRAKSESGNYMYKRYFPYSSVLSPEVNADRERIMNNYIYY